MIPAPYIGARLDVSTLSTKVNGKRPSTQSVRIDRKAMHLSGLHENNLTQGTAHQALKKTLDKIPQGGKLQLAQPFIQKFKVMKL